MHPLASTYKDELKKYEDYKFKAEILIRELLIQNQINFHKIESRVKDPIKLDEKIIRKNEKYESLDDITDIVGIRVITYFEDEVDKVAAIISGEFKIDKENSIDKRTLESDRFGYRSLHYVVSLSEGRKKLTEYSRFKSIKIEIQIRSILQHAWAEIEHDLGYKGEFAIPDSIKRSFFRVAALLETADIEFVNIKKNISRYEDTVTEKIKSHPEKVEVNLASVFAFVNNNELSKKLDKEIASFSAVEVKEPQLENVEPVVQMLRFVAVNTIQELETLLSENRDKIVPFAKLWASSGIKENLYYGIALFYLCYVIVGKGKDPAFAEAYYKHFFGGSGKHESIDIIKTYNSIR